eukprot:5396064-Ditylum_brightwellii.AAC.1
MFHLMKGIAQFKLGTSAEDFTTFQSMLKHAMRFINVQRLLLSGGVIGIDGEQGASNVGEGDVKFDFESIGCGGVYVYVVVRCGCEVEGEFC